MPKKWTKKYKRSIDCNNPKGFSQKAHCAGRKKRESKMSLKLEELVGKPITEAQFDEAAGKKDACYHKVKARYDVWPSAYASGALVKCRKVGAKNWGNKSKKEGVNEGKFRVHFDLNPDASPAQRLGLMSVEVTAKDKKEAEKMVASKFVGGMKLIRKNMTKKLKEGLNEAKYTHKYPSITAMAKDYERIFPSTGPAGGVKIAAGSKREATGKRSQPAFITIEGDKKLIDAYKKIAFNGRGNYSDVIKSLKESVNESVKRLSVYVPKRAHNQIPMIKKYVQKAVPNAKFDLKKGNTAVLHIDGGGKSLKRLSQRIYNDFYVDKVMHNESVNEDVFMESITKDGITETHIYWESDGKPHGYSWTFVNELNEAEYQGRKVKLGKVMQGDTKKFKVYVKNPKGNVVKVNFGQGGDAKGGTMRIRKSNPAARKSFRARHNCDNPGPRHKARYWSCKKW